jgi:hypothetical protein
MTTDLALLQDAHVNLIYSLTVYVTYIVTLLYVTTIPTVLFPDVLNVDTNF